MTKNAIHKLLIQHKYPHDVNSLNVKELQRILASYLNKKQVLLDQLAKYCMGYNTLDDVMSYTTVDLSEMILLIEFQKLKSQWKMADFANSQLQKIFDSEGIDANIRFTGNGSY